MTGRELWRDEYRRNKIRQRRNVEINIESPQTGIFEQCFNEFVKNSSIAGVKQMIDPGITWRLRIILVILFGGMCSIFGYFFWYIWFQSLAKPFVVTAESSFYPISAIDFPAIAICNINRISKKALFDIEEKVFERELSQKLSDFNAWQLGRLLDYTYEESVRDFLITNADKNAPQHAVEIIGYMKKLAPKCEEMLLACAWGGEPVDCKSIFTVRRTISGHCCAFNYVLDYDAAGTPNKTLSKVKRQYQPGYTNGLNLVIDPLIEDYAYTTRNVYGLDILIFDPTHFADPSGGRVTHRIAEPDVAMFLTLHSVKQIAMPEIRKYSFDTRECLFHDERKEKFKDMYSYSACIVACRVRNIQELCRCTPYFLPTSTDKPICTLHDLPCLNKYREKFFLIYPFGAKYTEGLDIELQLSLYCPDCYPDCEFTKHITRASKLPTQLTTINKNLKNLQHLFPDDINMTNKCFVSIYQAKHHGTLDRLDVIFYWFELVSNIGGMGGIVMGFCMVSVFELVYFFVIKFLILIIKLVYNY